MTLPDPSQLALGSLAYGELLDHLRKDLLLDARTDIAPGTVLASLVDNNGRSSFVQLPSAKVSAIGAGVITFPGATPTSTPTVVTVPNAVGTCNGIAVASLTGGGAIYMQSSPGAVGHVNFQGTDTAGSPGAGTNIGFYYICWEI